MAIRYKAVCAKNHQDAARQTQGRVQRQFWRRAVLLSITAMMFASTGCTWIRSARRYLSRTEYLDEFMIAHRNRALAAKAWFREQDCYCNERYLEEFKAGFLQGYADIANGADGCAPCVAPNQYWGWKYQSPGGQAAVDAWFAGYPIGVKAAEQDGVGHWGNVGAVTNAHAAPPASEPTEPLPMTAEGIPIQDGKLIGPNGPVEEMIVPGSTRIIPEEELKRALDADREMLPPVPAETTPLPLDSASSRVPSPQAVFEPKPVGVATAPAVAPPQAQTFTLNDLGDDDIEDIFGSIEIPAEIESLQAELKADRSKSTPSRPDDAVETARSTGGIPFKLE